MTPTFNRRQTLALAGAMCVTLFRALPVLAKNDVDQANKKFTGGKPPERGQAKVELP